MSKHRRYFVSHEASSVKKAYRFKEILNSCDPSIEIFLTSDSDSLNSGELWCSEIFDNLRKCEELIVLITNERAFENLWINFEIGAAVGRNLKPKIFIFGGVSLNRMRAPIKEIHCIGAWDTNRYIKELKALGYVDINNHIEDLKMLFYP
jgi:hypothetical protein